MGVCVLCECVCGGQHSGSLPQMAALPSGAKQAVNPPSCSGRGRCHPGCGHPLPWFPQRCSRRANYQMDLVQMKWEREGRRREGGVHV